MGELDRHHQKLTAEMQAQKARLDANQQRSDELAQEFVDRMTSRGVGTTALYEVRHDTTIVRRTFFNNRPITKESYNFTRHGQGWLIGCVDDEWHKYLFLRDDLQTFKTTDLIPNHPAPNAPTEPFVIVDGLQYSKEPAPFTSPRNLDLLAQAAVRLAP